MRAPASAHLHPRQAPTLLRLHLPSPFLSLHSFRPSFPAPPPVFLRLHLPPPLLSLRSHQFSFPAPPPVFLRLHLPLRRSSRCTPSGSPSRRYPPVFLRLHLPPPLLSLRSLQLSFPALPSGLPSAASASAGPLPPPEQK